MNLKKYGSKVWHSKEKNTQLTVKLRFAICHQKFTQKTVFYFFFS